MSVQSINVTFSLPRSVLAAAGVREQDLERLIREVIAIHLYQRGQLSLGKAVEVAGVATKAEMMSVLARHDAWLDYTADDAGADVAVLRELLAG